MSGHRCRPPNIIGYLTRTLRTVHTRLRLHQGKQPEKNTAQFIISPGNHRAVRHENAPLSDTSNHYSSLSTHLGSEQSFYYRHDHTAQIWTYHGTGTFSYTNQEHRNWTLLYWDLFLYWYDGDYRRHVNTFELEFSERTLKSFCRIKKNCFQIGEHLNLSNPTNKILQLLNGCFESGDLKGCVTPFLSEIDVPQVEWKYEWNRRNSWHG